MKVTQMPPVHAVNLVANSGNTAYGVVVIGQAIKDFHKPDRGLHQNRAQRYLFMQCKDLGPISIGIFAKLVEEFLSGDK